MEKIKIDVEKNRKVSKKELIENLTHDQHIKLKSEFENEIKHGRYKDDLLKPFESGGWRGGEMAYKNRFCRQNSFKK
ncbi:MAG: hypothetical protein H8D23_34870 [Candidatus Brocadiales bacterium]|nr:hypothetical protein [Candidatus Brocadiales bacterium]